MASEHRDRASKRRPLRRTPDHDHAVGGVGHGGPVAPDPLEDEAPAPLGSVKPNGGDPPPKDYGARVPFTE